MAQADFLSESLRSKLAQPPSIEYDQHEVRIDHAESNNLPRKLAVDTATALIAAISVAPAMTIIDKGITENAAGRASVLRSMQSSLTALLRRPGHFLSRPTFGTMLLLYASTYLTANYVDTWTSHQDGAPPSATTASLTKFGAVSIVNMTLSLNKDRVFARAFGTVAPRPLTIGSYIPWVIRDGLTIAAAFNLPTVIATGLPEYLDAFASRLLIAQLVTPSGIQFLSSPLHLLGLDMYNRPAKLSPRERIAFIRRAWLVTSAARAGRVFVAFGLGGVVNTSVRVRLMEKFA